jgi:hypothetical protein
LSIRTLILVFFAAIFSACGTPAGVHREKPTAEYSEESGRLQRLTFDANEDGRNDAVGVMDGTRVSRIELDTSGNGRTDRWEFYDTDRRLRRVGFSRQDDGVMDAVAVYASDEKSLQLEVSTRRDGRFDRTEFYESDLLARAEEDTDGDGRVDKWESYRRNPRVGSGEPPVHMSTVAFDDAAIGRPTRRLVYGPDGTLARVERAGPDGVFVIADQQSR